MSRIVNLQDWKEDQQSGFESQKKLFLTESQVRAYPKFRDSSPKKLSSLEVNFSS